MTMPRLSIFVVLISFCLSATAAEPAKKQLEWKKVKDKNDIKVYRAHTENTRFKTFRSTTRLEVENIQSFIGLMLDDDGYKNWVHMVSHCEIKGTDKPEVFEMYLASKMPWPVKNRDIKTEYHITQLDDYSIHVDLREPKIPAKARKGYITVPESSGYYELKTFANSKEVEITAEVFVDPGGQIPAFLINLITDDMSYYSAKKLRRFIQLDKYQNYETDIIKRRRWVVKPDSQKLVSGK